MLYHCRSHLWYRKQATSWFCKHQMNALKSTSVEAWDPNSESLLLVLSDTRPRALTTINTC